MVLTFNPDEPINCPECGENREDSQSWWIDNEGVWHFTCFSCGAEWVAKAERPE